MGLAFEMGIGIAPVGKTPLVPAKAGIQILWLGDRDRPRWGASSRPALYDLDPGLRRDER